MFWWWFKQGNVRKVNSWYSTKLNINEFSCEGYVREAEDENICWFI